jgi:hypothetical protein
MRLAVPRTLDSRQPEADTRGLSLVRPSISAPSTDDTATVLTLNGAEVRVPSSWQVAEAKHHESDIAILRQGNTIKILAGDREGRVHEIVGHSAEVRRQILQHRFGEEAPKTTEDREVDRIAALSADSITPASGSDEAEVDRLLRLADTMDASTSDDADIARLARIAEGL